jgi:hypothetical protein
VVILFSLGLLLDDFFFPSIPAWIPTVAAYKEE